MKTTYKLDIESPCKKMDWDEMRIADQAKFCSLCTKNVFDFINWTDEDIINFLNKTDDKICARLSHGQMDRIISIKEKPKINNWNKFIMSALLITTTNIYATEKNNVNIRYDQLLRSKISYKNDIIDYSVSNDTIRNLISGTLIQKESKKPIPNVIIEVKDTDLKINTDSIGSFKFYLPENYTKSEIVLVVVANYGFEGQTQRTFYKNELPITNIIIEQPSMSIGEVIYYKPKKWWQFWKKR
ncbi:peptidase associated/transthyretin-like domain-containing protein [Chryseobacterium luteum]|uniref:hypothetical protein n=1 Tax=Chryseobacterium luteum TaxID=421531 RepID=UPI0005503231|nr:hypothetical protein [Chryseobacterium luteum]